jgi:hypothetical protein
MYCRNVFNPFDNVFNWLHSVVRRRAGYFSFDILWCFDLYFITITSNYLYGICIVEVYLNLLIMCLFGYIVLYYLTIFNGYGRVVRHSGGISLKF